MGYEFRSRQHLFGLPLLHVTWGVDPFSGRARVARGIVAIGQVALGVVAVGPIAVGPVAVGLIACGLALAAGQIAAGLWALGQVALGGPWAYGQVALARVADGGLTFVTDWVRLALAGAWLAAAATLAVVWWRRSRPLLRLVRSPMRIALAQAGLAVVKGRIIPVKTVEAPVSRRAVIAYDVRRVRDDRPTKVEHLCEDFYIDDGSGRARILAADTELVLEPVRRVRAVVESRIVAHEAGGAGAGSGIVRAVGTAFERVLLPGDEVVVCGQATRQMSPSASQVLLAVHGGAAGPVLVTNRDPAEVRAEAQIGLYLAIPLLLGAVVMPLLG